MAQTQLGASQALPDWGRWLTGTQSRREDHDKQLMNEGGEKPTTTIYSHFLLGLCPHSRFPPLFQPLPTKHPCTQFQLLYFPYASFSIRTDLGLTHLLISAPFTQPWTEPNSWLLPLLTPLAPSLSAHKPSGTEAEFQVHSAPLPSGSF